MQRIKRSPFQEIQRMERDLDKFWENDWNWPMAVAETNTMDLYEEDGKLVAEISLPNFNKKEVSVMTDEGMLEISAEHKEEAEKKNKRHYFFRSSSNQYFRRVPLPDSADVNHAEANFKNGLLTVTMPKAEVTKKLKTITVQ